MGLNYALGFGNGRGNPISRAGDAGDINNNRAWVMNVFSRPLFARGLQFGGSMYRDQAATATTNIPYSEWIAAGHLVYAPGAPEFIAEFANAFPEAKILVTGVEDPATQAHSINESLHLGVLERAAIAEALLLANLG